MGSKRGQLSAWLMGWALLQASPGYAAAPSPAPTPAIAASVPTEVVEVVTGGNWTEGPASGYFRTVTLEVPAGDTIHAEVFIQWVGTRSASAPVEVIASRAVIEFNERHHAAASVSMEAESDGEVRIEITAESAGSAGAEPPQSLTLIASTPARYRAESAASGQAAQ